MSSVITLSIMVDNKTANDFSRLQSLIVAKEKLTAKDAATIAKIIEGGYLTQCGHDIGGELPKKGISHYDISISAPANID